MEKKLMLVMFALILLSSFISAERPNIIIDITNASSLNNDISWINTTEAHNNYLELNGSNANQNIDIGINNISMGSNLSIGDGELVYTTGGNTFSLNHGLYIRGANGFIDVATKLLVGGYGDINNYLLVGEDVNATGGINAWENSSFDGSIFPITTLIHDLGSPIRRWRNLYVTNISSDYIDAYGINVENLTAIYFNASTINVNTLNVSTINASYIYNPYFEGWLDMRGDPWYLGGTDLQIEQNLNVDRNITSGGLILIENSTISRQGVDTQTWIGDTGNLITRF